MCSLSKTDLFCGLCKKDQDVTDACGLHDNHLLSWAYDGSIRIWTSEGVLITVLDAHSGGVKNVLELTDKRLLSWGQDDRVLRLWTADGRLLAVLEGHTGWVSGALELTDGRIISWGHGTRHNDCALVLWSSDGKLQAILKEQITAAQIVVELINGRLLSGDNKGNLWHLWNGNGQQIDKLNDGFFFEKSWNER